MPTTADNNQANIGPGGFIIPGTVPPASSAEDSDSPKPSSAQNTQSDEMTSTEGKIHLILLYSQRLSILLDILDVTPEPSTTEPSKSNETLPM